jgi:predicted dehydrogenase
MLNVGVIGCGGRGTGHAAKLKAMPPVNLAWVCDIIPEKADALGAKHGVPAIYDFHERLDQVDVVWDATRPWERCDIVVDCAAAGKHIFSEKPIALDLATANRYVAAIEQAGVKNSFCYSLHFTNPYKLAKAIFASGELGRLVSVWTKRYMPTDMRPRWYGDQSKSGGIMLDFASHDLDLLCAFGGRPKTVFGCTDRVRDGIQADEHGQAMLVFDEGMGSSEVSWWSPARMSAFGVVGTKGSVIADGSGTVRKCIDGQQEEVLDVNASSNVDLAGNIGERASGDRVMNLADRQETPEEHFIRCVLEDREPIVTPYMARQVLEVVLAIRESAATGQAVLLP